MNLFENIQLALAGLKASKMRAFLTMLGIIIGIGSVIAIVAMGQSLQTSFTSTMSEMGVNNMEVGLTYVGSSEYAYLEQNDYISDEMIADLEATFAGRLAATSVQEHMGSGQVRDGRKYANTTVVGTSPGYKIANNIKMKSGRFILERDHQGERHVAVISDFMANKIFGNEDPLGKEVKYYTDSQTYVFTVVGVYEYQQSAFGGGSAPIADADRNTTMYIPVSTVLRLTGMWSGYYWFMAVAEPGEDAYQLSADIEQYMNRFYERNQNWGIYVYSMESMLDQMNTQLGMIALFIGAVAAISLLVGGIGVMNIMLVSVTERTREIGTRKALGARNSAIRTQFIVEAIIICLIGGILGVIVGILLGMGGSSMIINAMGGGILKNTFTVPVAAVVIAVGFSMVIGVFFGYYPASKAAKLDPIDALRYE